MWLFIGWYGDERYELKAKRQKFYQAQVYNYGVLEVNFIVLKRKRK